MLNPKLYSIKQPQVVTLGREEQSDCGWFAYSLKPFKKIIGNFISLLVEHFEYEGFCFYPLVTWPIGHFFQQFPPVKLPVFCKTWITADSIHKRQLLRNMWFSLLLFSLVKAHVYLNTDNSLVWLWVFFFYLPVTVYFIKTNKVTRLCLCSVCRTSWGVCTLDWRSSHLEPNLRAHYTHTCHHFCPEPHRTVQTTWRER